MRLMNKYFHSTLHLLTFSVYVINNSLPQPGENFSVSSFWNEREMLGFWGSSAESCMLSKKTVFSFNYYCINVYNKCNNNNVYVYIIPSTPFTILLSQFFIVPLQLDLFWKSLRLSALNIGLQHVQKEEVDGWGWCGAQAGSCAAASGEKWRKC